jgi:hypothetical protein
MALPKSLKHHARAESVPKLSILQLRLEEHDTAISTLHDTAKLLSSRLDPVMEAPSPTEKESLDSVSHSLLTDTIANNTRSLASLNSVLEDIISRLVL